jgi:hypothetical protein
VNCKQNDPKRTESGHEKGNIYWCKLVHFVWLRRWFSPHNPKVAGSNPAPATKILQRTKSLGKGREMRPFSFSPSAGAMFAVSGWSVSILLASSRISNSSKAAGNALWQSRLQESQAIIGVL